eukprot:3739074-Rhodomonas_salina.1
MIRGAARAGAAGLRRRVAKTAGTGASEATGRVIECIRRVVAARPQSDEGVAQMELKLELKAKQQELEAKLQQSSAQSPSGGEERSQ